MIYWLVLIGYVCLYSFSGVAMTNDHPIISGLISGVAFLYVYISAYFDGKYFQGEV